MIFWSCHDVQLLGKRHNLRSLSETRTREIPKITRWNIADWMKMHLGRQATHNRTELRRIVHTVANNCHSKEGWKKARHNIAIIFYPPYDDDDDDDDDDDCW